MDWRRANNIVIAWLKQTIGDVYIDEFYEDLAKDLLGNLRVCEGE